MGKGAGFDVVDERKGRGMFLGGEDVVRMDGWAMVGVLVVVAGKEVLLLLKWGLWQIVFCRINLWALGQGHLLNHTIRNNRVCPTTC